MIISEKIKLIKLFSFLIVLYSNDADNNGGRNQFTESQLNDLNKIVEIWTSKAKKLDTLLKKNSNACYLIFRNAWFVKWNWKWTK